jgi:hypothetical protein
MSKADDAWRAGEANRLLNEPLLTEALDAVEAEAVEKMVEAPRTPEGDIERRMMADRVQAIRDLRAHLNAAITLGRQASRSPSVA